MKIAKKINRYLSFSQIIFDYDLDRHKSYLNSFPVPKNLIQRSYFQYKCQCYQRSNLVNIRNNAIAFFLIIPVFIFLLLKSSGIKSKSRKDQYQAVFIFAGVRDIIPLSLKERYPDFTEINFEKRCFLTFKDFKKIIRLKNGFSHPFFILKTIYKMAMYRAIIDEFNPEAIICSSEYSFTSSVLTWYCEQNNIEHINVMHGEKLLNIRDSFFQFHECYVWDIHYVELFKELRAAQEQFIVDTPPSLSISNTSYFNPKYKLTYYLSGDETLLELERIRSVLQRINISNHKICLRPHPRYSDIKQVERLFQLYSIEKPLSVSIEKSFNNTKIIASLYSTVLYQGFISGKQIVVDDLSQKEKYKKLNDLKFIVLSKPHLKISDLL